MATAAETTSIIELVVGMVGAAPGADILQELVDIFDDGLSLEEIAVAISVNPAYNGDTGLFPDFLPNAIFAEQFLTQLLGDEVTADTLTAAVDEMTASLNAGDSRGAAIFAAITSLAATTDPAFADAQAALANQTEVAEYYSVTVALSSADLDELIAVLDNVDSDDASVATANTVIDDEIAANADLADLIATLTAVEDAKDDFLLAEATTEVAIGTGVADADTALDAVVVVGGAGAYAAGSDAVKLALIGDQEVANAGVLTAANTALATSLGMATGTGSVTGLGSAIAVLTSSVAAVDAAVETAALTDVALTEAEGSYDVLNGNAIGTTTAGGDGTVAGLIIISGTSLVLAAMVTEATDPGVTALLAATIANETADAGVTAATTSAVNALAQVENLDPDGARDVELLAVEALMTFVTPATATAPTLAEMAAEQAALDAGVAQLDADITALTFITDEATTEAAHATLTAAAVTAGFIDAATATDMNTAFDAIVIAVQADVDTAAADSNTALAADNLAIDFGMATAAYDAVGTGFTAGDTVTDTLAAAPLAMTADTDATAVGVASAAVTALAGLVAARATAETNVDALDDLNDAIDDAEDGFAGAGLAVPVLVDSAVKAATVADDVFIADDTDSQIISFGASGDDILFIGDGLTLNPDTTAGDEGDNAVLEVWITETGGSAVITIETSVFGSEAVIPETYTITLTGVAAADVSLVDGVVTVA